METVFEAHNLNRQLLSNIGRIGMQKAKAAVAARANDQPRPRGHLPPPII
jgi:molybdopterin/thiamine biosynthesis adenylyltransferase